MFYGYDCYAVLVLKIKSIKLLLSIIFKRFAVFFGLINERIKIFKGVLATCWWILYRFKHFNSTFH